MRRGTRIVATSAVVVLGLFGSATAEAASRPPIARPNPVLVEVNLDYVGPIPGVSGAPATLAPLRHAVIAQAVADQTYLAVRLRGDLGGFVPARVGRLATSNGRNLVGRQAAGSEIPQLSTAANGTVNSFAAVGGASFAPPPDQGLPVSPPSNTNTVPPPNQGFGGAPKPPTTTPPTTTPPTTSPPTTPTPPTTTPTTPPTTAPTPTTPTTTTTPTTPTTTPAPETPPTTTPTTPTTPSPPGGASCGTAGLTITSDHSTCQIHAVNMAPGDSTAEVMTIRNDSGQPFTLSLRAAGTVNPLWQALQMGVWEAGTAAPTPLPALLLWTSQSNTLTTLAAGASVRYEIELYLPTGSSNTVQGMTATIDLIWTAQG